MTDPRFLPIVPFATESHAKFYPRGPFISISLAQWALESDYGQRMSGRNNCFGIKATGAQIAYGNATRVLTKEYLKGHWGTYDLWFADYASLTEAFDAHATLLTQPWYDLCINAATPQEYAKALLLDHYATAPSYAEVLIQIMAENDLEQFDKRGGVS